MSPTPKQCACGFVRAPIDPRSSDWHREHKAWHLATFPSVDSRTVAVLDEHIIHAAEREAGCERLAGGDDRIDIVRCRRHGEVARVAARTGSDPFTDHGAEAWSTHVLMWAPTSDCVAEHEREHRIHAVAD